MKIIDHVPPEVRAIDPEWANRNPPVRRAVRMSDIRAARQPLDPGRLLELAQGGPWPPVALIRFAGVYYVHDGHHRCMVAALQRRATIEAEVTYLDNRAATGKIVRHPP